MLALAISFVGQPIQAEAANWIKITGDWKLTDIPVGEFAEDVDFTPKVTKNSKTGVYTVTMYEGTEVTVGVKKSNNNYTVIDYKSKLQSAAWIEEKDGKLVISASHFYHSDSDKVNTTLQIKLQDQRQYIGKKKNLNYSKYYGPTLTLKVISLKCPLTLDEQYTAQANERLQEALEEINASQYETELEKAGAIYDWVITNVQGDHDDVYHDWRDALNAGYAVCEGFSDVFAKLCMAEGIICETVRNDVHQWNIIMVDGKWYYTDTTPGHFFGFQSTVKLSKSNPSVVGIKQCIEEYGGEMATKGVTWIDISVLDPIIRDRYEEAFPQ